MNQEIDTCHHVMKIIIIYYIYIYIVYRHVLLFVGLLTKRSTCLYATRDRLKFVNEILTKVCELELYKSLS